MLRQILSRVQEGGTWTVADLAEELDATPELVEAALEELSRRGYLKPVGAACSGSCGACPLAAGCVRGGAKRVWTVPQEGTG
jgi:DNA-binding Lrp family transcriptional regulator